MKTIFIDDKIKTNHIFFVIVLLVVIAIIFVVGLCQFENTTSTIKNEFSQRDSVMKTTLHACIVISAEQSCKLKEQYELTDKIKATYFELARKYNSYGFSFTLVFTISSVVSAMLAFLILKKGWDNVENFYLKASFLTFFFASSLFGILPRVFSNKENARNNMAKYNYYNGLQIEIYNLLKDNNGYIKRNQPDSLDYFISNVNKNIRENLDLYFDTDIDQVPKDIKPFSN